MAEVVIPLDKGRKSSGSKLRLDPGFVEKAENAVYFPEDDDILHKIPGRAQAATLPSSTAVKGIDFLKFDTTDKVALLANSRIYEATAGATLGSWTEAQDQNSTAFSRTGSWLKSIPDTYRRQVLWTGAEGEVPLVRDAQGNWRQLGMQKPSGGSVSTLTESPAPTEYIRPTGSSNPGTVTIGSSVITVGSNFSDTGNAYDQDDGTYSEGTSVPSQDVTASDWIFASESLEEEHNLTIRSYITASKLPVPAKAICHIQITKNGGTSWETAFTGQPEVGSSIQYTVPLGQSMSLFKVRGILYYPAWAQTTYARFRIQEIELQPSGVGGAGVLEAGTHYYCCTEELTIDLDDKVVVLESAPSDFLAVTVNATTHTGVIYNLPAQANTSSLGVTHDPDNGLTLQRRIYRSTKTGAPPDLGYIGTLSIDALRYIDRFVVGQATLGVPSINTVWLEEAFYYLNEPPGAFLDACVHNGAIVYIPKEDTTQIKWSAPGYPEYYPIPQAFSFLFQDKNYAGRGITSIGDSLLVFLDNGIKRIRNLPFVTAPNFFIEDIEIDDLSQSEGLASNPKGYCHFHSQKGHSVVGFISSSGIWMTDGSLLSERGLGLVKLTSHKNWRGDLDTSRLAETELTFDPVLQTLIFDYYDKDGTRRCEDLHIAANHWVESGEDQMVPKLTGPHTLTTTSRTMGETGGEWRHWSLNDAKTLVLSERTGIWDAGSQILTHIETGWIYPAGARESFQAYTGWIYHTDWGLGEACDVDVMIRRDNTGIIQHLHKNGLSLKGERTTQLGFLNGSGQAVKVVLRHNGSTVSDATSRKAFGPITLEIEYTDERRKD